MDHLKGSSGKSTMAVGSNVNNRPIMVIDPKSESGSYLVNTSSEWEARRRLEILSRISRTEIGDGMKNLVKAAASNPFFTPDAEPTESIRDRVLSSGSSGMTLMEVAWHFPEQYRYLPHYDRTAKMPMVDGLDQKLGVSAFASKFLITGSRGSGARGSL